MPFPAFLTRPSYPVSLVFAVHMVSVYLVAAFHHLQGDLHTINSRTNMDSAVVLATGHIQQTRKNLAPFLLFYLIGINYVNDTSIFATQIWKLNKHSK